MQTFFQNEDLSKYGELKKYGKFQLSRMSYSFDIRQIFGEMEKLSSNLRNLIPKKKKLEKAELNDSKPKKVKKRKAKVEKLMKEKENILSKIRKEMNLKEDEPFNWQALTQRDVTDAYITFEKVHHRMKFLEFHHKV